MQASFLLPVRRGTRAAGTGPRLDCPTPGGVVQLVRTPACHAGGRGFESRRSRFNVLPAPGNNLDWDDYWVFSDPRFELASGPDEVLLGFLAQMVHPVVQPDAERGQEIVNELNRLLAPDGWVLKPYRQMSGRPVYGAARTGTGPSPAIDFAHEVATRIEAEHISQQITRMEGAVDADPELAIGTAKEFVESVCKSILDDREIDHDTKDDLPALVRKTTKALQLTPDDIDANSRAADTIKRMLMNLTTIVQGSAELRNAYGTGHGKSKAQGRQRLKPRHARLAVGAAATLGVFLYETHEARE
jgi:hypothetical protein